MDAINLAITILGYISTVLTIAVYVPQLVKTFRSKDTSGVSIVMYLILQVTAYTWVIYGSLITYVQATTIDGDISAGLPIVITNFVVALIGLGIVMLKIINLRNAKKLNLTERQYIDKMIAEKAKDNIK